MQLNATLDRESSKLSNKIIFSCDHFELTHEDIAELKKKKLIGFVAEETLPKMIPCQVLIFVENTPKARVVLFNNDFTLPKEVYDEQFLNKDLIDRCEKNGGFRMEFMVPVHDKAIKMDFSFKIGEE